MTTFTRTYGSTLERLIAEEVFVNASTMVQGIIDNIDSSDPIVDRLEDFHSCLSAPDYSKAPAGYLVYLEQGEGWTFAQSDDRMPLRYNYFDTEREAIEAAWDDSGDEPDMIEAMQHWLVSDWLAEKLEEVGALVSRDVLGFNVWGRTKCGESLSLDADLTRVVALVNGN